MKLYNLLAAIAVFFTFVIAVECVAGDDVITLKDGTIIKGEIIAKNEKQVVIKVGDEFKTIERSKIKSIDKKKKEADVGKDSKEDSPKKEKPDLGRAGEDKKKKAEEEEKKKTKNLASVKQLYKKWMRNRRALVCKPCKGTGQINCKLCKGVGWYRSASVGGGLGRVKCHDCSWKGKFDCKRCKKTGRSLPQVKVLFWDILDPEYKDRENVKANKSEAIKKGILTAQDKGGFSLDFDTSRLTKKFNLIKNLKFNVEDDCATVTWKCVIGDESWTEGLYFRKVKKKWYWVPDESPDEIPDEDEDE